MSLQGQVALVTGGASGIGLATCKEFLKEGANVAVCDISTKGEEVVKSLQAEFGAERSIFVKADVCSDDEVEAAFGKTKSHFKKLTIVVNNAGIVNDSTWEKEVDLNLKGVIRGMLAAWKYMGKQDGGSGGTVVNLSSIAAVMIAPAFPFYTATKMGVIGVTRTCGEPYHVERTGVKVMAVCPGQTDTPIFGELVHYRPEFNEPFQKWTTELPKQTAGNVARAIVHIINDGSSGSVWMSENEEPTYRLYFPEYNDMRVPK
ncbi:hypothetical protein R5R35_005773 [Gryllus longicercus]|uniref:Alcohol dehydrogenase n=1 Tax=Gryllus longicercus TaxID=2509291 RepID=A0AAN9W0V4_9ORTH